MTIRSCLRSFHILMIWWCLRLITCRVSFSHNLSAKIFAVLANSSQFFWSRCLLSKNIVKNFKIRNVTIITIIKYSFGVFEIAMHKWQPVTYSLCHSISGQKIIIINKDKLWRTLFISCTDGCQKRCSCYYVNQTLFLVVSWTKMN